MEQNFRQRPIPKIVEIALEKANKEGLSEEMLCEKLQISHTRFNRWKTGVRTCPDPRIVSNKLFYINLAKFLNWNLGKVFADAFFVDSDEREGLSDWVYESLVTKKLNLDLPQLSNVESVKLRTLLINLQGREEFLDILFQSLKIYVNDIRHEEWFEDPIAGIAHLENVSRKKKQEEEEFWGQKGLQKDH